MAIEMFLLTASLCADKTLKDDERKQTVRSTGGLKLEKAF